MASINFTPEEVYAIFFAASEFVTEVVSGMGEPDCDTALLWLGIQAKVMRALREEEEMRGVEDLANWAPEGAA